ncbi:MAG: DSD1 family PLP-dependent enzyme [Anaerolineae bacterium]|nr:DSD1 family PLP-dependent enzyme [Anaerolineae bacterium]
MSSVVVGLPKAKLDTPALCLNAATLERNIARMAAFFEERPAALRPHSKTHKCPTIAWMQLDAGAIGITCAKLGEAEVMARAGIRDVLIANQIVGEPKIARLVNLAAYTDVMVAVDDAANAEQLSEAAQAKGVALRVLVEVDVGMRRCGTAPGDDSLRLAQRIEALPGLVLEGIMGYEGFAVMIPDMDERRRAAEGAMAKLVGTRDLLLRHGVGCDIVSGGGTGTYHITGDYPGVTEVQAGSYATMDAKYKSVGAEFDLALTLLARVISVRDERVIIDAGMKTMTHEFGMPTVLQPEGWELTKLSEEHGFLEGRGGPPLKPGDTVELVPSHGCTTINLHDAYHVTRDDVVEAIWPIAARGALR